MLDLYEKCLWVMTKTDNTEEAKKNIIIVSGCRREIELLVPLLKQFKAPEGHEIVAYAKRTWNFRKPMEKVFTMDEKIFDLFEAEYNKIGETINVAISPYYPENTINEIQADLPEEDTDK